MTSTDERNRERSTSKPEPMDWSTTKSESSLPSPVRSRSRSGSPSPPKVITINLFPLSDSIEFAPKHLSFNPDQEIKVGRVSGSRNQKEAKQDNGVFSCDVMSREHALLKEENGKILIKDLKSTHGTFVNNTRLGDGTDESDWRTLNHGDVITFGHSVRRNQNLYKHLSAYIFYPKETGNETHSPSTSNGTTSIAANSSTIKMERISEKTLLSPSAAISHEATPVANTGISQGSMLQSRSEGPASYYISKSGGLPSTTPSATNTLGNKFGGLSVTKSRSTDNVTQASEEPVTESKQISTSINTNEEMLTSIQKLKIGQPDEKSHIKVESKDPTSKPDPQDDDGDVIMENNENDENDENNENINNVENDHKLVSPEIKPDMNLAGEATVTQISTRTTNVSSVSFVAPAPVKDKASPYVTRETKQSRASRREKEIKEIREVRESNTNKIEDVSNGENGEGPSYVTPETSSVAISSTTSRKRKHEEMDDEDPEELNDLKEKLATLQHRANKRGKWDKWDFVYGMVAGALGFGACVYIFGA